MTVALDSALKTVLDGNDRRPVIRLLSTSFLDDIPFDGNTFTGSDTDERRPDMIAHSSGRLVAVYVRGTDLYAMISDDDRTQWNNVALLPGVSGRMVSGAAAVELADGSIGVVLVDTDYDLHALVMSADGTVTAGPTLIADDTAGVASPTLCRTSTGVLLVYRYTDGSGYYLYRRTAGADMTGWSGEQSIPLTGLDATHDKGDPDLFRAAGGDILLAFAYMDAFSDPNELWNVYLMVSDDDGATWSAPEKLTAYTEFGADAHAPSISETSDGDITVAFHEQAGVMIVDTSDPLNCCDGGANCWDMHYDPASQRLFYIAGHTGSGAKGACAVWVIDTTTWSIEKCYNGVDSSPKYNYLFADSVSTDLNCMRGDGQRVPIAGAGGHVAVIDHSAETITEYHFADDETFDVVKNVDKDFDYYGLGPSNLRYVKIDATTDRLYCCFAGEYAGNPHAEIGYIDLSEAPDVVTGMYDWHPLHEGHGLWTGFTQPNRFWLDPANDIAMISSGNWFAYDGVTVVVQLSTGGVLKRYLQDDNPAFPQKGLRDAVVIDGKIYGVFDYNADQDEYRGLCIVDMATDTVTYDRPTYATVDEYALIGTKVIDDGARLLFASISQEVKSAAVVYDIATGIWTRYGDDNVPGLPINRFGVVEYDPDRDIVFLGAGIYGTSFYGMASFIEGGAFYTGKYMDGVPQLDGSYDFGDADDLTLYSHERDMTVVHDADDVLWAVWSDVDLATGELSLQWDRDAFSPDVASDLVRGEPVRISWEVGRVAELTFTLARGHLYDYTNTLSILAPTLAKGRKITCSFGERIDGEEIVQQQGVFVVTSTRITYQRGSYPTIEVTCQDRSTMWDDLTVLATQDYGGAALSAVFVDILGAVAGLDPAEYTVPDLDNAHLIYNQWLDVSLQDIVADLCNHFRVFAHWTPAGIFTLVPFRFSGDADHAYAAADTVIEWTPDDGYASHVNRVIASCETQETVEVLYGEERVQTLSGTVGWWGGHKDKTVYYSQDRAQECRYPRLDVIQSVKDYTPFFNLIPAGGGEAISSTDEYEKYCIVTIDQPDMSLWVFAQAAVLAGFAAAAVSCDKKSLCGFYILMTNMLLSTLVETLSGSANYHYDVWARPVGHERQLVQAVADDVAYQNQLGGLVVPTVIEDPLAYTVAHCQMIADYELNMARYQRNRVTVKKVAHLKDEIGDIVSIPHPYSGITAKMFVPRLVREYTPGGSAIDTLDGWIL